MTPAPAGKRFVGAKSLRRKLLVRQNSVMHLKRSTLSSAIACVLPSLLPAANLGVNENDIWIKDLGPPRFINYDFKGNYK